MKRWLLGLFLATVLSTSGLACEITQTTGAPQSTISIISLCRTAYENGYNPLTKTPLWVQEHLVGANINNNVVRENSFREDKDLPILYRSTLQDYIGSGYSRGHMAPAGDFSNSAQVMSESFLLSNMVPQIQRCNNAGIWSQIEETVRTWARDYKELYVVTGPIYINEPKYIGNKVQVPDYLYKVVLNPYTTKTVSFLVPNSEQCKADINTFVTIRSHIESLANVTLFPLILNLKDTDMEWR